MKELTVKQLSREGFLHLGTYADMINPEGPHLGKEPCCFYRDMALLPLGQSTSAGFSITRVSPRPFVIDELEYHTNTGEVILPLDGDILVQAAPASGNGILPAEDISVFFVPKGTLVMLRPGVWHAGPFAAGDSPVNILVALPERTYANDCTVIKLKPEECRSFSFSCK